jgi:hypothetical protein
MMKGYYSSILFVLSLSLASNVLAMRSWETLQAQYADKTSGPDYMVTDTKHRFKGYLNGIARGCASSDEGALHKDYSHLTGYKLTDMRTHRSGYITGVHHYGSMDVSTANGKNVRYQYVKFNVR